MKLTPESSYILYFMETNMKIKKIIFIFIFASLHLYGADGGGGSELRQQEYHEQLTTAEIKNILSYISTY